MPTSQDEKPHLQIAISEVEQAKRRPKPESEDGLGFGVLFSDHMLHMEYEEGRGWHSARIEPYGPLSIDPAALALHYGQQVFDGLKAFRTQEGGVQLFRARDYLERMNRSSERLCMPALEVEFVLRALKELVRIDRDWVPRSRGASLYIRPVTLATEAALGVKVSREYSFFVLTGPVGAYYAEGFNPTRILVTDRYVRAVRGGIGEVKTPGNYAASLMAAEEAYEQGYTQVLWLDACNRSFVEEVGTSNIFFLVKDVLVTPPLSGSILPGVTRRSVIQLAKDWGIPVEERPVSIQEVIEGLGTGALKEIFASGTAAVISPVGQIGYQGEDYTVHQGAVGELSQRLYDEITGIQYGERPDPHGWMELVSP
jgi:branched-chain amino acid aminotransferase